MGFVADVVVDNQHVGMLGLPPCQPDIRSIVLVSAANFNDIANDVIGSWTRFGHELDSRSVTASLGQSSIIRIVDQRMASPEFDGIARKVLQVVDNQLVFISCQSIGIDDKVEIGGGIGFCNRIGQGTD